MADAADAGSRRRCARRSSSRTRSKQKGSTDVVLLGMGGSSLAPEVMRSIIGRTEGYPALHVVDSTDPAQIRSVERAIDFRRTIFLVASKSGTTLEVNILKQHFFHRAVQAARRGRGGASLRVDDRSRLEARGDCEAGRLPRDLPGIADRWRPLFGALELRARAGGAAGRRSRAAARSRAEMAQRCASTGPDNSGLELGVVLGELALAGRDKPTLIAPPGLASFGAWLEQLVAESLGKLGKGIIPDRRRDAGPAGCRMAAIVSSSICDLLAPPMRRPTRRSNGLSARAIRSCASSGPIGTRSAPNSIDGSSRRPSPGRCSA